MAELPPAPSMPDIIEEHLSELGFLWEQRERGIVAPDWTVKDLATIEERAEAHLDGLRIAGAHAVALARPALAAKETGLAAAAAFVMLAFGRVELEHEVLQALATAPPKARDGIRLALRHADITRMSPVLIELATSSPATAARAAALDVLAFHRLPPPKGIPMLLADPDPEVRRLVFDAAGRFGGPWSYDVLREALDGDVPALRVAALRASARMGLMGLDESCRQAGTRPQKPVSEALEFLGLLGNAKDLSILQNSMTRPDLAAAALSGMGKLGAIAAIPTILEAMTVEPLAEAATRAFSRITGAEAWVPPDPVKARAWWEKEKGRFPVEGRWQAGFDVSKDPFGPHFDALPLDVRLDLYLGARAKDPVKTADRELERRIELRPARV
jgi:uncharacterized protein (TIGR02270 family)